MPYINQTTFTLFIISIFMFLHFFRINKYIYIFLFLPSTFLHELSHYIISMITFGKPTSFSIIPKNNTLGYVISSNYNIFNGLFISLAPLINMVIAYYIFISDIGYFKYIISFYLIAGGVPSSIDIKNSLKSLIFFTLMTVILLFFYVHFDIIKEILIIGENKCLNLLHSLS